MERLYTESFLIGSVPNGWTGGANGIAIANGEGTPNTGFTASVSLWRDGDRRTQISIRPSTILPLKVRFIQAAAGITFIGFN